MHNFKSSVSIVTVTFFWQNRSSRFSLCSELRRKPRNRGFLKVFGTEEKKSKMFFDTSDGTSCTRRTAPVSIRWPQHSARKDRKTAKLWTTISPRAEPRKASGWRRWKAWTETFRTVPESEHISNGKMSKNAAENRKNSILLCATAPPGGRHVGPMGYHARGPHIPTTPQLDENREEWAPGLAQSRAGSSG